jgi:hypothetical protein
MAYLRPSPDIVAETELTIKEFGSDSFVQTCPTSLGIRDRKWTKVRMLGSGSFGTVFLLRSDGTHGTHAFGGGGHEQRALKAITVGDNEKGRLYARRELEAVGLFSQSPVGYQRLLVPQRGM